MKEPDPDPDAVRRGYDAIAEEYADAREDDPGDRFSELLDRLPDEPRVLDAGCGDGRPVLTALGSAGPAVGLDLLGEQVRRAADNAASAVAVQGDLSQLPFSDNSFDGLTAYHSLIHVPLAKHAATIGKFARVLRSGGRALLSEGSQQWCGSNPDWLDSGVEMHWSMAGPEATRAQLREAGFVIEDEWAVGDDLADAAASKPFFLARLE